MNTQDNFRPAIGLIPWFLGGAALLTALLIGLAAGITLTRVSEPALQAPRPVSASPDTSRGRDTAYDGSAYVEYLTPRMPIGSSSSDVPNPNTPISGTGSAYDGGAYVEYLTPRMPIGSSSSDVPNPNTPISGTGSAYDGGAYRAVR